jgi:hypothetical protein
MSIARRSLSAEKLFSDHLSGDLVTQIMAVSHSPEQTLALLRPDILSRVDRWSFWVDILKLTFFSCLFLTSLIRLLFCLQGDLEIERNRAIFASRQRQRDCMDQYLAEGCEDTEILGRCEKLRVCAASLEKGEQPSYFTVIWGMKRVGIE